MQRWRPERTRASSRMCGGNGMSGHDRRLAALSVLVDERGDDVDDLVLLAPRPTGDLLYSRTRRSSSNRARPLV